MIYDIVRLPYRYPDDVGIDLESTMCVFDNNYSPDNDDPIVINNLGRYLKLPSRGSFNKYKMIETTSNAIIERIFISPDEINISGKKIHSDVDIFPISMKVIQTPYFRSMCEIYRYIHGITSFLHYLNHFKNTESMTIDNLKHIKHIADQFNAYNVSMNINNILMNESNPIHHVVNSDDERNIKESIRMEHLSKAPYLVDTSKLTPMVNRIQNSVKPKVNIMKSICKEDVTTSDIKPYIGSLFGLNSYTRVEKDLLFDVDQNTYLGEEHEYKKYNFISLMNVLSRIPFTYIDISYKNKKYDIVFHFQYPRTMCFDNRISELFKTIIISHINLWLFDIFNDEIESFNIRKTWEEEVFIEINKTDRSTRRIYVDLVMYDVCNLSLN